MKPVNNYELGVVLDTDENRGFYRNLQVFSDTIQYSWAGKISGRYMIISWTKFI